MSNLSPQKNFGTTSKTFESEVEIVDLLSNIYQTLPEQYRESTNFATEIHLQDTRIFTEYRNRYIDAVFTTWTRVDGGCIVFEFTKGCLLETKASDCCFRRGYLDLCYEQVPNFNFFIFVAEDIKPEARFLCKRVTESNKVGVKVSTTTYNYFVIKLFEHYIDWAVKRERKTEAFQTAQKIYQLVPFWLGDDWLENQFDKIYKLWTPPAQSINLENLQEILYPD